MGDLGSIPGSGRSPGREHGNPHQYSCLENPLGLSSLAGCSSWGCKELARTEWLSTAQHPQNNTVRATLTGGRASLFRHYILLEGLSTGSDGMRLTFLNQPWRNSSRLIFCSRAWVPSLCYWCRLGAVFPLRIPIYLKCYMKNNHLMQREATVFAQNIAWKYFLGNSWNAIIHHAETSSLAQRPPPRNHACCCSASKLCLPLQPHRLQFLLHCLPEFAHIHVHRISDAI